MRQPAAAFVLVLAGFLAACSSSETDKYIRIAQLQLRAHSTQPGLEYNLYRTVTWDAGDRLVGELDDASCPDWARGMFSACVRWEESFHRDVTNPEAGPDQPARIRQTGRAQGWILVGEGMRFYVLELTVTFEDQTFEWINAWDPPE